MAVANTDNWRLFCIVSRLAVFAGSLLLPVFDISVQSNRYQAILPDLLPELFTAVDLKVEQLFDVHLGCNSLGGTCNRCYDTDTQLFPQFPHDILVTEVKCGNAQFLGNIVLCVTNASCSLRIPSLQQGHLLP